MVNLETGDKKPNDKWEMENDKWTVVLCFEPCQHLATIKALQPDNCAGSGATLVLGGLPL
jgi:hypothetical protein